MVELSSGQKKILAAALSVLAAGVIAFFVVCIGWMVLKAVSFASAALVPLVVGLFLAMFFKPYYYWWLKIARNPSLAVLLMMLSILVPAAVFAWCFGSFALSQISTLMDSAPAYSSSFIKWFNAEFPNAREFADKIQLPYQSWIYSLKESCARYVFGAVGYVTNLLSILVSLVFFVYFITRPSLRGKDFTKEMPFFKDDTKIFVAEQIDSFIDIVVSFSRRQMVICLIEGLMYGAGFHLVGLVHGFWIGFALGLFNFVPLMGTALFLPAALLMAYFGEGASGLLTILVAAVWMAGQILDGYIITPKIQGDKTGLGYAGVIFSFFFWGIVFNSFLGLLLAIPLSAFCVVLWRAVKSRYIKPII